MTTIDSEAIIMPDGDFIALIRMEAYYSNKISFFQK